MVFQQLAKMSDTSTKWSHSWGLSSSGILRSAWR